MTTAWQLSLADLYCRVEWRDGQLYWQIQHPNAPGGQPNQSLMSGRAIDHQPIQCTTLAGGGETEGP